MKGGEFYMGLEQAQVSKVAELDFARGKVGLLYPLVDAEAEANHGDALARHTVTLTRLNTAHCIEDRPLVSLADGTTDPYELANIIVPQLPGGAALAATQACVAAEAVIIRDAKNFQDAYEKVSTTLAGMGEEDGAHAACGASGAVESSVANPIEPEILVPALGLIVPEALQRPDLIQAMITSKKQRLESGFYSGWDPQWHMDYVSSHFPHNFAHVAVDPNDHETGGHKGSSIYVVTHEGHGFAKNRFVAETGQQAFSATLPKMYQYAHILGGSDEERLRIRLGFGDNLHHVAGGLVRPGMGVFAEAA